MTPTVARWRDASGQGLEHLVIEHGPGGITVESVVVTGSAEDRAPGTAWHYRLRCDPAWCLRDLEVEAIGGGRLVLRADGAGAWRDGGDAPLPSLAGALDVDLAITPFTNTLPIRRLGLEPGAAQVIRAAFVDFPTLAVTIDEQRYTCLEVRRRYLYEAVDGTFTREIVTDADGLVVSYPGLFERVV